MRCCAATSQRYGIKSHHHDTGSRPRVIAHQQRQHHQHHEHSNADSQQALASGLNAWRVAKNENNILYGDGGKVSGPMNIYYICIRGTTPSLLLVICVIALLCAAFARSFSLACLSTRLYLVQPIRMDFEYKYTCFGIAL